jgi:hypothetical protein
MMAALKVGTQARGEKFSRESDRDVQARSARRTFQPWNESVPRMSAMRPFLLLGNVDSCGCFVGKIEDDLFLETRWPS